AWHILDLPLEVMPERVHMNRDRLSPTHPGELGFLEIRSYPELVLGQRHQALPRLYTLPELGAAITDHSFSGRANARVTQVEFGLIERGLRRLNLCLARCDGTQGARRGSLVGFNRRRLSSGRRVVLIELRLGNDVQLDELGVAPCVAFGEVVLRVRLSDGG